MFFSHLGIHFRVIGKAKCGWTEWLVRESRAVDGTSESSDSKYWGKEEHLNPAVYICGSKTGNNKHLIAYCKNTIN